MEIKEYLESLKGKEQTGEQTKCPRCGGDIASTRRRDFKVEQLRSRACVLVSKE